MGPGRDPAIHLGQIHPLIRPGIAKQGPFGADELFVSDIRMIMKYRMIS